jgi:hypothetical protein
MKKRKKVSQATVNSFSKKLEQWSKTLPPEERGLVRLLVDRATAVNVADLGDYDLTSKVQRDAERVFQSLRNAVARTPPGMWVEAGDVWLKSRTTKP